MRQYEGPVLDVAGRHCGPGRALADRPLGKAARAALGAAQERGPRRGCRLTRSRTAGRQLTPAGEEMLGSLAVRPSPRYRLTFPRHLTRPAQPCFVSSSWALP